MRDTTSLLIQYAGYHRDPRNIATHLVGIPLIVLGIGVLLSYPAIPLDPGSPWMLTPAWALWAAATLWYLTRWHLPVTVSVIVANGLAMMLAQWMAAQAGDRWALLGLGLFAAG